MSEFVSSRGFEEPESVARLPYRARFGREFGAVAGRAIDEGIGALARGAERGAYAGSSTLDRALPYMGMGEAGGMAAMLGTMDVPKPIETPLLSADEVNKRYAPVGPDGKPQKITDAPMREGLARLLGEQKRKEIERDSIINRFAAQAPWYTQLGTFLTAPLADPLNLATAFIPGIGEEAILSRMAAAGFGRGFVARTIARAGAGATAGLAGQAPLSVLRYGMSAEEFGDYDLRSAFRDMMFGAAGAAALQAGFGAFGEALGAGARRLRGAPGVPPGTPELPLPKEPGRPVPPEEPPPGGGLGGPAEEMENIFIRPQPEPEEPTAFGPARIVGEHGPGRRLEGAPRIEELRLVSEEAALRTEDASLLRQLRDLPRGGVPAANILARLEVVERRLADETIGPEERKALLQRRDELLTDTTPEKLKEQAAPLEQRRILQTQRERIAQRLEAIAAERKGGVVALGFRDLADQMARVLRADAATKADAARAAVSQIVDGRPVDVTAIFEKPAGPESAARPPSELAAEQRELYEGGYAPGIAQEDFEVLHNVMYGEEAPPVELSEPAPKPGEAIAKEGAVAKPGKPGEGEAGSFKTRMTDLLRRFLGEEAESVDLKTLDDDGAIGAALKDIEDTGLMEEAYTQAAECLTAGEAGEVITEKGAE